MNKHAHRRFLSWLAAILIGGILTVLTGVVVVDPYNLYGAFAFDGVNVVKPELSRHVEEIKLTQAVRLKPDTLILGNSRAEIGFDPESPAITSRGFSAYNLAIRGTAIGDASRGLEYLLKMGVVPKRIVIALDFVDFMQAGPQKAASDADRFEDMPLFPVERRFWRFDSLFSMASIKDSIRTLVIQSDEEAAITTSRGFNPLREYEALARNEGYYVLFRQRAEENAKVYLKKSGGRLDELQVKRFRRLLERAANAGAEVSVVIYPYHAQILALFEQTGLFRAFVDWKRLVVSEVADLLSHRAGASIAVFDFSGYGSYQCEAIPVKGDLHTASRWYWEAGHFKKALGEIVLARIFSETAESDFDRHDANLFGVKLNLPNFDSNLERIDRERKQCVKINPQIFDEVNALVQGLAKESFEHAGRGE